MSEELEAALHYAQRYGWRVIPIKPGKKYPEGITDWQKRATTDPSKIQGAWTIREGWGVGVATGEASGIFVLDVDGEQGMESLLDLEHEHGHLPDTVECITGSGGRHIYFRLPPGVEIRNDQAGRLGPGLDIRGEGGQVLAPPTVHPTTGRRYSWAIEYHPEDIQPADPPDWLIHMLTSGAVEGERYRPPRPADDDKPGSWLAARWDWHEELTKDGATYAGSRIDRDTGLPYELWVRPDKQVSEGTSATLGYGGSNVLKVFTPNWPGLVEGRTYDPFGYYVAVRLGQDPDDPQVMSAAGKALFELRRTELDKVEIKVSDETDDTKERSAGRQVTLTPASKIPMRPVHWFWEGRVALGTLALLGGREGIGKSILAYTLAADVTKGRLPGAHFGQPKAVIVAATEDSWAHTIVPRLAAAGANLDRVFRVDITTKEGMHGSLSFPNDLKALEQHIRDTDCALVLLDPLMSRLSAALDTHKDAEVRQALEPLTELADRTNTAWIGLIHVNKSMTTDPLSMLMASRAFTAVARAVLFVAVDPEDEAQRMRVLGQPKNNLGRLDLPSKTFSIEAAKVADTDEGSVWTGKLTWHADTPRSIADVLTTSRESREDQESAANAADWLEGYLRIHKVAHSKRVWADGRVEGFSETKLGRARKKIGAGSMKSGLPSKWYWAHPSLSPDAVNDILLSLKDTENA